MKALAHGRPDAAFFCMIEVWRTSEAGLRDLATIKARIPVNISVAH